MVCLRRTRTGIVPRKAMGAKSTTGTMLNKEAGTGKAGESASSRPSYEAHELTR